MTRAVRWNFALERSDAGVFQVDYSFSRGKIQSIISGSEPARASAPPMICADASRRGVMRLKVVLSSSAGVHNGGKEGQAWLNIHGWINTGSRRSGGSSNRSEKYKGRGIGVVKP